MDREGAILELSRSLTIPRTREDTLITTMEVITMEDIHTIEGIHTTIVALRMVLGMEEAIVGAVPTLRHPPRRI